MSLDHALSFLSGKAAVSALVLVIHPSTSWISLGRPRIRVFLSLTIGSQCKCSSQFTILSG
jgi:hypothetical protein